MNARKRFVAVLFGAERREGALASPGDADCRWRVAARLHRDSAVNDDADDSFDLARPAADAPDGGEEA